MTPETVVTACNPQPIPVAGGEAIGVGRIVHYRTPDGRCVPAVVLGWDMVDVTASEERLTLHLTLLDSLLRVQAEQDDPLTPVLGTWHLPERR